MLNKYGYNPVSYVSLEDDKKYYFGRDTEGVIAYVVVVGAAVCAGDPMFRMKICHCLSQNL